MGTSKTASVATSTLVLSDHVIADLISLEETIHLVESAFQASVDGGAVALPIIVESLPAFDIHFGIKSGYLKTDKCSKSLPSSMKALAQSVGDVLGLKAGGYWFRNPQLGLPGHRAVLVLLEPARGNVVAVMSANAITRLRTAAAGGVAAKYLARKNAQVAGVIGAGEQAHAQLEALCLVRNIQRAYVWARRPEAASIFAATWKEMGMVVEAVEDIRAATECSEVVITATPSFNMLVLNPWIRAGTHITAVGSDGEGKQELDVQLLQRAKVVVDKKEQSVSIGELQHAVKAGLDAEKMIYAELGEICQGWKAGRENDEEITVFDSSGVSFQDLIVAGYLVKKAKLEGVGEYISL